MSEHPKPLELYQFAWSPFCLVQRRILEFSGAPFKLVEVPSTNRSMVWRLTRQRYYQVPILRDGRSVIFETGPETQVIAKYLEAKLNIGLFPSRWDGLQRLIWRVIEDQIEGFTFRLNDIYYRDFVPPQEQLDHLRWKERKFGRGCLDQWRRDQRALLNGLAEALLPFERMLLEHPFVLDDQPRFVDFDLWGMLANFLYSGHYRLPRAHPRLRQWYDRMTKVQFVPSAA